MKPLMLICIARHVLGSYFLRAGDDISIHQAVFVPPTDQAIRFVGRHAPDETGNPRFDMNGFQVQFSVIGCSEVKVSLSQTLTGPSGWYQASSPEGALWNKRQEQLGILLQEAAEETTEIRLATGSRMEEPGSQPHDFLVYVDGVPQMHPSKDSLCWGCTFDTSSAQNNTVRDYVVASGLSTERHDIVIFKASDPEWSSKVPTPNWLTFHGVKLDAGNIAEPRRPRRQRRLEFIGDSSMSGYCNLCRKPQHSPERQGSYAMAWPSLLCDKLQAECHSVIWAGFGVHQNCCGNNKFRMPQLYSRAVVTDDASEWNFDDWKPDGVVMNLGANDHIGLPDGASADDFQHDYLEMVKSIGRSYGPDVQVFLACGPIGASRGSCPHIRAVASKASDAGIKAHFLDQQGFLNGTFGEPCCGHPSVQNGLAMADAASNLLERELGWAS